MRLATNAKNDRKIPFQTVASIDCRATPLLSTDDDCGVDGEALAPRFRMVCQPICQVGRRGGPAWVETLIRGSGPDARLSPMEVVGRGYRRAGLEFDLMVVDAALAVTADLRPDTRIGINIRPCSLNNPGFIPALQQLLKLRRVAPQRLVLELVEFHGPVRLDSAQRALQRLRDMRVLIALDDFGPGYPNLDVLAEGLVDFVKLDRSLVTALARSPRQRGVLQGIAALASSTGFTLVAEGIETPAQMYALRRLGIEWMQGFLFGRPVAPARHGSVRCNPTTSTLRPAKASGGFNPETACTTKESIA